MKCWCFNEEQLKQALDAWESQRLAPLARGSHAYHDVLHDRLMVSLFLRSKEAREHKLIVEERTR